MALAAGAVLVVLALAGLAPGAHAALPDHLTNFQNEYPCSTQTRIVRPRTTEDVQAAVQLHTRVQPVGVGHSWNQPSFCASPEGLPEGQTAANVVLTTKRPLNIQVDEVSQSAWVDAGIITWDLLQYLGSYVTRESPTGYTLPAFPWFVFQTIGGAVATNTHGSSLTHNSLSSQVLEMEVVLANGTVRTFSPERDPFLWRALAVSVGRLGVISRLRMRLVKEQPVRRRLRVLPIPTFLELVQEGQAQYRANQTLPAWMDETEFFWITQRNEMLMVTFTRGDVEDPATRHAVLKEYAPQSTTAYNTSRALLEDPQTEWLKDLPLLDTVQFDPSSNLSVQAQAYLANLTSIINQPVRLQPPAGQVRQAAALANAAAAAGSAAAAARSNATGAAAAAGARPAGRATAPPPAPATSTSTASSSNSSTTTTSSSASSASSSTSLRSAIGSARRGGVWTPLQLLPSRTPAPVVSKADGGRRLRQVTSSVVAAPTDGSPAVAQAVAIDTGANPPAAPAAAPAPTPAPAATNGAAPEGADTQADAADGAEAQAQAGAADAQPQQPVLSGADLEVARGSAWEVPEPRKPLPLYAAPNMARGYLDISRSGVFSIATNATVEAHLAYLSQPAAVNENIRTVLYDQYEVAVPVSTMADCMAGLMDLVYGGDLEGKNQSSDKGFRSAPLIRFIGKEDALLSLTGDEPRLFLNLEDYIYYNAGGRRTNEKFKAVMGYLRSSPLCGAHGLNGTGGRLHWGKAGWPDPGCWHGDKEFPDTWCDFGCAVRELDPGGRFADSGPDRWTWEGVDLERCCTPSGGFAREREGCVCAVRHARQAADCPPAPYYTNR